jgi:uncharacterized paraquat-inducible protein A
MAKNSEWTTCEECENEFKVISDTHLPISYCPYCSYELEDYSNYGDDDEWDED